MKWVKRTIAGMGSAVVAVLIFDIVTTLSLEALAMFVGIILGVIMAMALQPDDIRYC